MSKQAKKKVSVYLVGGGSGGHVSPLRSIAESLHHSVPEDSLSITFVCEKGGAFDELMDAPYITHKKKISAGKFRRYHGDSFFSHITDVKTILLNARDLLKFLYGCLQAFFLLLLKRPDVIFLKGGFVCVPIGWAARILRVAYVTHDSDAVPGLANRLTAKGAKKNFVAIDAAYPYPEDKKVVTGVPIKEEFSRLNDETKQTSREKLGLPKDSLVVLVTGGGLGAQGMNVSVVKALQSIATSNDSTASTRDMYVLHLTGKALYEGTLDLYEGTDLDPQKIKVIDFTTDMISYVDAADIVISRAGATAIAELAAAKKACIFIPGAHLTGGQQIHNASILDAHKSAIIVPEQDIEGLVSAVVSLSSDENLRGQYGSKIAELAVADSASKIASLLLSIAHYTPVSTHDSKDSTQETKN